MANKAPIQLPDVMPEVKQGQIVLCVGFPGTERGIIKRQKYGHKLAHVFGTLRSLSQNNMTIYDDNPKREKNISFGGMSGGPIFKIAEKKDSTYHDIIGINYQAKEFKRLRVEDDIEEIGDDIWIFGFPLDGKRLEAMLNYKIII